MADLDRVRLLQERRDAAVGALEVAMSALALVGMEDLDHADSWRKRGQLLLAWAEEVRLRMDALIDGELRG